MGQLTVSDITRCQTDLLFFTKTMFKAKTGSVFVENHHHHLICRALEKVIIGQTKRLIINIPPRYSKTEIAVINFIAWSMGICPDSEFIHASYSQTLAEKNTGSTKDLVENEIYKQIFANMVLAKDTKAKGHWSTKSGGQVYATGSNGTITGFGAGKFRKKFGGAIIIDDPHKASEANSEVRRNNVISWYNETMKSRANSSDTPIIIIMQRLHQNDLAGYLLGGGSGEEWETLCLPAIDEKGEPLWPYKHNLVDLKRLEKSDPYTFSGQYMQRPSPLGGGMFKTEWWKYYSVLPAVDYKIITADTAQKVKEHNDYSVIQCWGYANNQAYLIDQIRGKWEAPELRKQFDFFWNKHYDGSLTTGRLRSAYIEDKASGTGLIQDLKRNSGIPVIAVPRNIDKVTRAMDIIPYINSGYVYLPEKANWLSDYLMEFERFTPTNTHDHDDQIDPTLDAIGILLRPASKLSGTW